MSGCTVNTFDCERNLQEELTTGEQKKELTVFTVEELQTPPPFFLSSGNTSKLTFHYEQFMLLLKSSHVQ